MARGELCKESLVGSPRQPTDAEIVASWCPLGLQLRVDHPQALPQKGREGRGRQVLRDCAGEVAGVEAN